MEKKLTGQIIKQVITIAKSKYETDVEPRFIEIEAWKRDGLTDEQIAKNLGIAYSSFREYKNKYSAFSAVLKKGKEIADIEVFQNFSSLQFINHREIIADNARPFQNFSSLQFIAKK